MNAPRALPTWSGPVGLAETNSTLTERPVPSAAVRPQLDGSARIAATVASSASSRSRRLRKPGAATSAAAIGLAGSSAASAVSSAASAAAMASGAIRYGRASLIARLLAKSPCTGSAGRSTSTAGRSASAGIAGSAPLATVRSQARSTAARTIPRIVTAWLGLVCGLVWDTDVDPRSGRGLVRRW